MSPTSKQPSGLHARHRRPLIHVRVVHADRLERDLGKDEILDPDGVEYPSLEAVREAVVVTVRDLICGDVRGSGVIDFRYRVDAEDGGGDVVYSLSFKDAVNIIPE